MPAHLSRSVEDYLKAIYRLSEGGGAAGTSEIAQRLDVAPASVTAMAKKLAEWGHLEHMPYRGVRLTRTGRSAALSVMRRHRILEAYLMEKLGYDWDTVDQEAERLEHAVSDELITRMAAALGEPQYDPHGAPIPSRDGKIELVEYLALADIEPGRTVQIRQVEDDDPKRLRFLGERGLKPGAIVTVLDRQPFNGPLTLLAAAEGAGAEEPGAELVIGRELAAILMVAPVRERA